MKKSHIIALVVIAVAIMMIISTVGDASTYVAFDDATKLAKDGKKSSVHVVGELLKGPDGEPSGMVYNPKIDPNVFEFVMVDSLNVVKKVILNQPKPQDLDRSEKVVVVGKMDIEADCFKAEQVILKCPSKYNNPEPKAE